MPGVKRRRWEDGKTGLIKESPYWYLYYSVGGVDVLVRTNPPTGSKRAAEMQLARILSESHEPKSTLVSEVLEGYRRYLEVEAASTYRTVGKSRLRALVSKFGALR